jgi:threonine/homoserine/homoserine lactone efflux protein
VTNILKIAGLILLGLIALKIIGIVLGALIGTVATVIKIVLYLGVGAFVFYGIKKLVDEK